MKTFTCIKINANKIKIRSLKIIQITIVYFLKFQMKRLISRKNLFIKQELYLERMLLFNGDNVIQTYVKY